MNKKETDIERIMVYDITVPIRQRLSILRNELKRRKASLGRSPKGYLKCKEDKYGYRYYYREDPKDLSGHYIKKNELGTASLLAQKEYNKKLVACVEKEIACLDSFLQRYENIDVNMAYNSMHNGKKILIDPFVLEDEEYIKRWLSVEYSPGYFPYEYEEYYTLKGMRVHSKSEIIIANALDSYEIPYRYEYPIWLDDKEKRPDFLCLNVATRKEYVWEHFGMMGVEDYADENIAKINRYVANGYYPGENAIFTFESSRNPLDTRIAKTMIERYLL